MGCGYRFDKGVSHAQRMRNGSPMEEISATRWGNACLSKQHQEQWNAGEQPIRRQMAVKGFNLKHAHTHTHTHTHRGTTALPPTAQLPTCTHGVIWCTHTHMHTHRSMGCSCLECTRAQTHTHVPQCALAGGPRSVCDLLPWAALAMHSPSCPAGCAFSAAASTPPPPSCPSLARMAGAQSCGSWTWPASGARVLCGVCMCRGGAVCAGAQCAWLACERVYVADMRARA